MSSLFIATPSATAHGCMLFGKNADRPPNEGQAIVRVPALAQEARVMCTYLEIPQPAATHEMLLSKSYHTWGAEMGVNVHGVAVGNAPVFTKFRGDKNQQNGLTGADLVRLLLERSTTAQEAFSLLTTLLANHGQAIEEEAQQRYALYNSFLIADPTQALVVETAGEHWVGKRIEGVYALASSFTIGETFDFHSPDVVAFAQHNGWVKKGRAFSFSEAYGAAGRAKGLRAEKTQKFMQKTLEETDSFSLKNGIHLLQSHHPSKKFNPSVARRESVCKHITRQQTALQTNASMLAELRTSGRHTVWLTGTSNPCLSVFKPFFLPGENLYEGIVRQPTQLVNNSLWWQAEQYHRKVATNYQQISAHFEGERQMLQQAWLLKAEELLRGKASAEEFNTFSTQTLNTHLKKIMEWNFRLKKEKLPSKQFSPLYNRMLARLTETVTPVI